MYLYPANFGFRLILLKMCKIYLRIITEDKGITLSKGPLVVYSLAGWLLSWLKPTCLILTFFKGRYFELFASHIPLITCLFLLSKTHAKRSIRWCNQSLLLLGKKCRITLMASIIRKAFRWEKLSIFPLFKSLRIKIVKYRPVCQDCRQKVWVEMAISKAKSCVTFASPYFH